MSIISNVCEPNPNDRNIISYRSVDEFWSFQLFRKDVDAGIMLRNMYLGGFFGSDTEMPCLSDPEFHHFLVKIMMGYHQEHNCRSIIKWLPECNNLGCTRDKHEEVKDTYYYKHERYDSLCTCTLCNVYFAQKRKREEEDLAKVVSFTPDMDGVTCKIADIIIEARETHPFETDIGLIGGVNPKKGGRRVVQRKKKKGKKKRNEVYRGGKIPETVIKGYFGYLNPRWRTSALKYSESVAMGALTAGSVGSYFFRLNSLFDTNLTGTGHQPNGYDTVATSYGRYRVFSVDWDIDFPSLADAMEVSVAPYNGSGPTINTVPLFDGNTELPGGVKKISNYNGGGSNPHFKGHANLMALAGADYVQYMEDRYQAAVTTNPSEAIELNLAVNNFGGVTQTPKFDIVLTFNCEFYDPITSAPAFNELKNVMVSTKQNRRKYTEGRIRHMLAEKFFSFTDDYFDRKGARVLRMYQENDALVKKIDPDYVLPNYKDRPP